MWTPYKKATLIQKLGVYEQEIIFYLNFSNVFIKNYFKMEFALREYIFIERSSKLYALKENDFLSQLDYHLSDRLKRY